MFSKALIVVMSTDNNKDNCWTPSCGLRPMQSPVAGPVAPLLYTRAGKCAQNLETVVHLKRHRRLAMASETSFIVLEVTSMSPIRTTLDILATGARNTRLLQVKKAIHHICEIVN